MQCTAVRCGACMQLHGLYITLIACSVGVSPSLITASSSRLGRPLSASGKVSAALLASIASCNTCTTSYICELMTIRFMPLEVRLDSILIAFAVCVPPIVTATVSPIVTATVLSASCKDSPSIGWLSSAAGKTSAELPASMASYNRYTTIYICELRFMPLDLNRLITILMAFSVVSAPVSPIPCSLPSSAGSSTFSTAVWLARNDCTTHS